MKNLRKFIEDKLKKIYIYINDGCNNYIDTVEIVNGI